MLLHGNLMCWRQFEDVIPLLEKEFDVYAVSFDGFDGTGETTYTTAQEQADKLEEYLIQNCDGTLDALYAESLGCGPAVYLKASKNIQIRRMILSGPEYLDFGIWNPLILKIMPPKQYQTAKTKTMPAWALRFMGQTEAGGTYEESHRKAAEGLPKADRSVLFGFWTRGYPQPSGAAC